MGGKRVVVGRAVGGEGRVVDHGKTWFVGLSRAVTAEHRKKKG